MKKVFLLFPFLLLFIQQAGAQGSLNARVNLGATGFVEGETYPVFGLGIEARAARRWTIFGEFEYGFKSDGTAFGILVDRSILSIQPGVKFYFAEALKGFNLSLFGTYAHERMEPAYDGDIPPAAYSQDRAGIGLGVGYMTTLTNRLSLGFDTGLAQTFGDSDNGRYQFRLQIGYSFL